MAEKLEKLIEVLKKAVPEDLALEWDNCGFQIGDSNSIVSKIFLTLDLTEPVLDEAIKGGSNLIISHHPLLFKAIKSITDVSNRNVFVLIQKLITNRISLYCMHTNLDVLFCGLFCRKLDLVDQKIIDRMKADSDYGIGCYGSFKKAVEFNKFMKLLSKVLGIKSLKVIGSRKKYIKTAGFCGGGGARYIYSRTVQDNMDVFITSDIKYHDALYAAEQKMLVIDAGHYPTEKIMIPELKKYLEQEFLKNDIKGIRMEISKKNTNPFRL